MNGFRWFRSQFSTNCQLQAIFIVTNDAATTLKMSLKNIVELISLTCSKGLNVTLYKPLYIVAAWLEK